MRQLKPLKGRLSYYSFMLGMAVLLMVFIKMCSTPGADPYPRIPHRHGGDTLNVAMEFSPMGVYASGDTLSGFYYELLNDLSTCHNIPTHIIGFSHGEDMFEYLEKGDIDIIIADLPLTTDIKRRFAYTRPLITDRQVLVQLRDTVTDSIPFPTQLSLIGHTVYVPVNSMFKSRLQNLAKEMGGNIDIVEHPEYGAEQLVISVALGETPNAVVNNRVASILKRDYPVLDTSVELSLNQFQSWLFNQADTAMRDSIDCWLDAYKATATFRALSAKYF